MQKEKKDKKKHFSSSFSFRIPFFLSITMFTEQCHAFLSSQTPTLLLPKGAPTTTGLVHAQSKRLHAKQTFINHSQRCLLELPEPSSITPIKSLPKKPTLQPKLLQKHRLHASTNESTVAADLHVNGPEHLKPSNPILKGLDKVFRFIRPYALIGPAISIPSISLLAVTSVVDLTPTFFKGFTEAFTTCMFHSLYIIGVNQLYDIEIDKINKPNLPLASGEISMTTGKILTASFLIMSFIIAVMSRSPALVAYVLIDFFLGTAYSAKLPLLRWKSNPFLAAISMAFAGGILHQIPFFLHMQVYVLKRQMVLTKPVIFSTAFFSFMWAICALVKDIPDVEGDKANGVQSFAIWFGLERVFKFCVSTSMVAYGISIAVGASSTNIVYRTISVLGHATLASVFWFVSQSVDLMNKESVVKFEMLLWQLLYAEYFLIHFIR